MYSFRLYPTSRQRDQLTAMLAAHCELYNAALEERREAWRRSRVTVRYADQSGQLKAVRRLRADQAVWSFTSQQQTLRRVIHPANTSRRCAHCGHTEADNRVSQAEFRCMACGHTDHADRNASLNILRAGTVRREVSA